jgi:hypothetical protein
MDTLIAGVLFIGSSVYLYTRNTPFLIVWILLGYLVSYNFMPITRTIAVVLGICLAYAVCYYSTYEHFEQEDLKKKEDDKEPEATGKSTPHVDLGTTILHAYRNLSPEQIGGMKRDTKELMELQKELMGTLSEMKPAIEQGAELLGTFSQFFGSGAMA